jgi:hypothetical protein
MTVILLLGLQEIPLPCGFQSTEHHVSSITFTKLSMVFWFSLDMEIETGITGGY